MLEGVLRASLEKMKVNVMERTLKDSFRRTLPTDRKNRNRRLTFCGFYVIIRTRTKFDSFVKQKQNFNKADR